jgi:hypothetical protein
MPKRLGNGRPDKDFQAPHRVERNFPSRCESQLPAATFTLESFLGFHLGCCASAAWALHRANVSHNVNFSRLLTSFRIGDMHLNSCPVGGSSCISGSTTPKEELLNRINQLKFSASWFGNSTCVRVISFSDTATWGPGTSRLDPPQTVHNIAHVGVAWEGQPCNDLPDDAQLGVQTHREDCTARRRNCVKQGHPDSGHPFWGRRFSSRHGSAPDVFFH